MIGAFFNQTLLGYAAFVARADRRLALARTLAGLRLRMVGENPAAAETQGVAVRRVRVAALVVLRRAGRGRRRLPVAGVRQHLRRGHVGRPRLHRPGDRHRRPPPSPSGVLAAALFFGFATALQFHFQAMGLAVPFQFFLILPYVLTLIVLAGRVGRATAPAALGQPYERA